MRYRKYFGLAALMLAWAISAYAADATGTWKASFDTPDRGAALHLRSESRQRPIDRQGHQ